VASAGAAAAALRQNRALAPNKTVLKPVMQISLSARCGSIYSNI
jgi:hypothetical protein